MFVAILTPVCVDHYNLGHTCVYMYIRTGVECSIVLGEG